MQTSVAVFIAFSVIYVGSLMLPHEFASRAAGWAAQATSLSGAVATFMIMRSHKVSLLQGGVVLLCTGIVTTLATLATVLCVSKRTCQQTMPLHTAVFSSAVTTGAAGYVGFLLASAVGLPLWATIVASIAFAPLTLAVIMPVIARGVTAVVDRME